MREADVAGWTRSVVLGTALLLALLFGAVAGAGKHGSLDPSFTSLRGRVVTSFGPGDDAAGAVAFQSDGRIVVAGRSSNGAEDDFVLARYRADGSLDSGFGAGGRVRTAVGSGSDVADALVVEKDGKIVVAGSSSNGSNDDFALARYNGDGSLDPTFDGDGIVTSSIGSGDDRAYALAVQGDGKLVVAGSSEGGSDDFALARYNPDGSLDVTFDGDGKVTTPIGSGNDQAFALVIQKDGKIVAAGSSSNGSNDDFALARYNPDGSLDMSFDGDGIVTSAIGASADAAYGLVLTKEGKLVAAGSSFDGSNNDFALACYNGDGSLDATFDGDGKVTTAIGSGNDEASAIVQQKDGKHGMKLVAGGSSWNGSNDDFALVRYNLDGSLDNSFGTGAKVTTSIGAGDDHAHALAANEDGSLVAAGYSSSGSSDDFALVRYQQSGALASFTSRAGRVTSRLGSDDDVADAVVLQALQKTSMPVAAGSSWNGSDNDFALARYKADGSLDKSFGAGGSVMTPIGPGDDNAHALVMQSGKLVAAGSSWNGSNDDFALVRYNPDGSLDTTFGIGGKVTTAIGSGNDEAYALVLQGDGKLVAAGSSWNGSQDDFALARYNPDGSPDTTFGTDGTVTTPLGSGGVARALVLQGGKLVVAGSGSNGTDDDFAVVRFNSNGSLDPTFGAGGSVMTPIGSGDDKAYALVVQSGKLVAAGSSWNGSDRDIALVRYTTNGSLDSSFNGDGKVTTAMGSGDDDAYALALQKNGKVIAAGASWNGADYDFALVRYEMDGSLNTSFGSGGDVTTPFGSGNDEIRALAVAPTTLVAAGTAFNGSDDDFALARYMLCDSAKGC